MNNSCFKILRVDSGKGGNINLRLTPSVKVISQPSQTLALCHVTRTTSFSLPSSLPLSLFPLSASLTRAILLAHSLIPLMEPMKSRGGIMLMQPVLKLRSTHTYTHIQTVYNTGVNGYWIVISYLYLPWKKHIQRIMEAWVSKKISFFP